MRRGLLLLVFIVLVGCNGDSSVNVPEREVDEYAVYSTIIDIYKGAEIVVVMDHTSTESNDSIQTFSYVDENIAGIDDGVFENFRMVNADSHLLENDFGQGVTSVLLKYEEVEEIFEDGGWNEFYEKYPNSQGIMTLSRVGFNDVQTQALIYVGNQSHWEMGYGVFYLLNKVEGVWVIVDEVMVWIS